MPERRNILITGASSGLGAQLAREFAARGRNLALCARRLDRLEQLRAELLAAHPGITVSIAQLDVNEHARVFTVFREFAEELGGLDRVVVNAGLGKGQPIGSGRFDANAQTATTNFIAVLAQCEAAMEIFRAHDAGHLVVVSSMSALRGMPGNRTAYAASKAGAATLAEGIRADTLRTPIAVTTLFPGFIATDMTAAGGRAPLQVSTEKGVRAMVRAIERESATAKVPAWPWVPIGLALRWLPLRMVAAISG
ncbi:SDR family oxidoreductase [Nocardia macrotermitis]|uniref:Putative oxidoreductase n=1 Tax=Nocardia macrotermitis TaxID=2585198 RepID=A0A7K0D7K1_9NOCA|nr:SDR family oxidoreductase [Nocardia macrotermitis]MQY21745.1 putative oxidoreductase [Nocardia macrotermitis]